MALVPKIHVLEPERDPAKPGLCEEDLEPRVALEHTGQYELGYADRRCQPEIAEPLEEGPPQPLHDYRIFFGIFEGRLVGALTCAIKLNVCSDRHLHIDSRCPELVVLGRRITFGVGQCTQQDAL